MARVGVVALLLTVALLAGCGKKGPLYLPEPATDSGDTAAAAND